MKRHVLKNLSDVVKTGNWKVQLNVATLFRKVDGEDDGINPIWSTPHVIMRGTDLEEVIEEMYQKILGDYDLALCFPYYMEHSPLSQSP